MRFLSTLLPIILLVLLVNCTATQIMQYPQPPEGIPEEKYESFSGVLTISVDKRLSVMFPGLMRWLTEITNVFEKRNKGIYLRCETLPSTQRDSALSGAQPTDILLCAPGEGIQNRCKMNIDTALLPAFSSDFNAVPIAAGGYLLGFRGEIPHDLSEMPADSIGWNDELSTVWIALCEQFTRESTQNSTISTPDIGLPAHNTPEPTSAPQTGTHLTRHSLRTDTMKALYDAFLSNELRALPLNETQVSTILEAQSDGSYTDIRFLNSAAFTDRIAYAMIPASSRSDASRRAEVSARFIEMLLSDEAQTRLAKYQMFPTAICDPVHETVSGMSQIENSLRRSDCVVQLAEESTLFTHADSFLSGDISAREIMRKLRNRGIPAAFGGRDPSTGF